ncbi:hypothetical protein D3C87_1727940 [compost metagenome]
MIVDQINLAILQQQLHIDFGITAQKLRHVRMNHDPAHRFWHTETYDPFGLIGKLTTDLHHRTGSVDHLLAPLEHLFPTVAQAQLARGSLQEPGRQRFLQPRNTATDRRG